MKFYIGIVFVTAIPIMAEAEAYASNSSATPSPDIRFRDEFALKDNPSEYAAQFQQPIGVFQTARNYSGVTIYPAPHLARGYALRSNDDHTADSILKGIHGEEDTVGRLIQSSFQHGADATFHAVDNGFVHAAIQAYSEHHHLIIRPEDVWLAILTQLSSYINAHSEELRGSFVAHEGKKTLRIEYGSGNRFTVSLADFAYKIGSMIQDHVVDPELREWMMPAFTTTTSHDVVISSIVMMASMQAYFTYKMGVECGLPSVTLLGSKEDYELILRRLDKLRNYGKEPSLFADVLTPIVKRFVLSFDLPESEEIRSFWNRIFSQYDMGSGPTYMTGWITAFGFWNAKGECLYNPNQRSWLGEHLPPLTMDGVTYHTMDRSSIPSGFCTVPVQIDDNGEEIMAEILAGSIGYDWTSSGGEIAESSEGREAVQDARDAALQEPLQKGVLDTVQPRSGWWVYEKVPADVVEARRNAKDKKEREDFQWRLEDLKRRIEHNRGIEGLGGNAIV